MHCPSMQIVDINSLDTDLDKITRGFGAVRLRSLFPETALPCDIFCLARRSGGHALGMGRLFSKEQFCSASLYRYLSDQEVDEAYIRCGDQEAFDEYFNHQSQDALHSGDTSPQRKAELLYDQAEFVVKRVFRERPTCANIGIGQQLVGRFSTHVLTDRVTLQAMLSLFSKDYYTFSHCIQVAILGMSLCKFLGWKAKEVEDFGLGALFHDIGKNAIDDRILNKPGKLDKEEFDIIKKHPLFGYQQIKQTRMMTKDQLSVVLQHHEALDGSGYPGRLKDWQIHKYARVARIVDIYDALTTRRVYKDALPSEKALKVMNEEMRNTLDIRLFEAFTKFIQSEKQHEEAGLGMESTPGLGAQIQLELEGEEVPVKGVLAGWETDLAIMIRIPPSDQIGDRLAPGRAVTVRYVISNALHAFTSTILKYTRHPFPLLFLSYPESIHMVDLRKSPRIDSYIRVKVCMGKEQHPGAIVDLSRDGCRLVVKLSAGSSPQPLAINERITFAADFSGRKKYEPLEGIISNAMVDNEKMVLGVRFGTLAPPILEMIDTLCHGSVAG